MVQVEVRILLDAFVRERAGMRLVIKARANEVDAELCRLARRAGVVQIAFGHESGSPEILRAMNKQITVEQIEAGSKVDVTGTSRLFGPAVDVAWRLGREIRRDMGLEPIWSVGPSKLIAKVATRLVKPRGEYIVGAGEEEA